MISFISKVNAKIAEIASEVSRSIAPWRILKFLAVVQELSEIFKLFADETRLRIICAILNTELCVCDLCELLNLSQSAVSHQLQLLRSSKLVKYRKEGKQVYYSLEDEHIESIIKMALAHTLQFLCNCLLVKQMKKQILKWIL